MDALIKLLKSLNHTVKKVDIIENLNNTILSLNNDVIPMVEELLKLLEGKNNLSMEQLPELSINRDTFKAKDIKIFVNNLLTLLKNTNTMSSELVSITDKEIPDLLGIDVINFRQANILNIITKLNNLVLYTPDLVLYIINLIDSKVNNSTMNIIKFKIMEIKTDLNNYGKIIILFKDSKNLINEINKLSVDKVLIDGKDNGIMSNISSFKSKIPLTGFIGNPIYHVKLWFADREINKYEILKERKKLIELKILELKARQAGENDPKLQKAIEYHEDRLSAIEYKIRKIEQE